MPSRDGTRPAKPAGCPRVYYLESLGRQVDHAAPGQVAQDAHARQLQDVDYCGTLEGFRPSREGLWRAKLAFAHAITSSVLSLGKARKLGCPSGPGT